ncbi:PREDICTED: interferon alpha/beta receptor 2 [Condylura cristata]|uniref:interferon alpha/beta receptor 2 n=1 Tax=Condylura cristata TaxID=143302 RepID=UPI000643E0F2|nr:PREDICTED: interferon alpha/beta receptor 2 [Condylura cristata]XP_012589495.1 PREDICTED: interferon alpha/beta receptor 2 [Condylura cristata]
MLWSQNAPATTLHTLSGLVFISLLLRVSCVFADVPAEACTFKMTLHNLRPILSWEFKPFSAEPTHYTLSYIIMSKDEDMITVTSCENTSRSFCDLSKVWVDMSETYIPKVVGVQGNRALGPCLGQFNLATQMSLEPPQFEIVGFTDHINVLLNIPPRASHIIDELRFNAPLVSEEQSEGIVKKHKLQIYQNHTGNFTHVIDQLTPNTNYCISVYFEQSYPDPKSTIKSPFKCILLPPKESSESEKIGGIIFTFLIPVIVICTIVILKRTGYICLRNDFPKVLQNLSSWIFLKLPPSETIDKVEVIIVQRKKRVGGYNYDESDSDTEAAPRASAGDYTMHGLTGRLLCLAPTSSEASEEHMDPDTEEPKDSDLSEPEADTEPLLAPGSSTWQPECPGGTPEGPESLPQHPLFQETSSSPEHSGNRVVFNVNLNSVCMRALDNSEVPQMLTLPGNTVNPEDPEEIESSPLVTGEEGTGTSGEGLWSEDVSSNTSDTSGSDVDLGNGYLAR